MTGRGRVEAVHVATEAEAAVEARESVDAVAGRGLRGDRYFDESGSFSGHEGGGRDLTLIEAEAVDAIAREADVHLEPGAHRRNVTTTGVALNHLVDERFRVGDAVCRGVRLCEPCAHLQSLVGQDDVLPALVHRGGLRADVLEGGPITVGDPVHRLE